MRHRPSAAYRAILARYPDDIDAWFQLGEILFHHGPLVGRPMGESEEAWRKVLSYEPRNLFAVTHVARIAVVDRRASAVDSLLAPFPPDEQRTDRRLLEIVLLRAIARGDTAAARGMAKDVRRWESLRRVAGCGFPYGVQSRSGDHAVGDRRTCSRTTQARRCARTCYGSRLCSTSLAVARMPPETTAPRL